MKYAAKSLLLLISLLGFYPAHAQLKENHKLLWRISGNGLTEDSYLYGTMHLQDERVFNFSDSVLLKLDACKAFALEVNPDSLIYYLFKDLAQPGAFKENKVKEMLSPNDYEALAARFKTKTGFDLDQIDKSDPAHIIQLMENEKIGKKDNATFLDAYLYDIALRRNKNITSLEDVKDQLEAFNFRSAKQLKQKLIALAYEEDIENKEEQAPDNEHLIKIYHRGDLDAIWKYFTIIDSQDSLGKAFVDKMLTQRNHGMHDKLVAQIHNESTFAAVGAGHLPGDEGLISLLRNSGYTVEAVPAIFTDQAQKQRKQFKNATLPWQVFKQDALGYSVEMPRQPFPINTPQFPMPIYFYPEIGTGVYYMTVAYNTGIKEKSDAQVLKQMVNKMGGNMGTLIRKKDISTKEIAGLEAYYKINDGSFIRSRILVKGGMMYMLATISNVQKALESENAQRYFKSFKRYDIQDLDWQQFKSEEGAFTIKTFGEPNYKTQQVPDQSNPGHLYNLHLFTTQNAKTGTFYLFRYNNMPKGMVLKAATEETFSEMAQSIANSASGSIVKSSMGEVEGYPAYSFEFAKDEFRGVGKIMARGNRMYLLLAATSVNASDKQEVDYFLDSFAFLPYQQETGEVYENESFSVLFPTKEVHLEEQEQDEFYYLPLIQGTKTVSSTSQASGNVYLVNKEKVFKYFTFGSDSGFYNHIKDHVLEQQDSIIWERNLVYEGMPAKEFLIKDKAAANYQRGFLLPTANHIYTLWSYVAADDEKSGNVDRFLKSFKVKEELKPSILFRSKGTVAQDLLEDLLSQDSLTLSLTTRTLPYFEFDSSQVDDIYSLYQKLNLTDRALENEIKDQLVRKLAAMPQEKTIVFFEQQYKLLPDTSWHKAELLKGLADMKMEKSVLKAKELLLSNPPQVSSTYYFSVFDKLKRSESKYIGLLFPELLSLLNHEYFGKEVLDLTVVALDSALISTALVEEHAHRLDSLSAWHLKKYLNAAEDDGYYESFMPLQDYVAILKKLSLTPEREAFLRKLISAEQNYLSIKGIEVLLAKGKTVDNKTFEMFAANKEHRLFLYQSLKELNKLHLFPKKFLTQEAMAEAVFVHMLDSYDEYPDKIDFLKKLKVNYEGKTGYVYVYKCSYEYEGEKYESLGYAGLFSTKKGEVEVLEDISNYSYDDMPAKGQIDKVVKKLVANYNSY